MNFFVVFASYILLAVLLFGTLALFIRVFTIFFKK